MQLNVLIGILALINISTGADVGGSAQAILASGSRPGTNDVKTKFLDNLINNMTIPEMGECFCSQVSNLTRQSNKKSYHFVHFLRTAF